MRRILSLVVAIGAAIWLSIIVVQRFSRDPEVSNPTDLHYDAQTQFAPDFVPSDPALTHETPDRIQDQITDKATGKGLADAPYFIEVDDGRFAFGYADANGFTRPIYTNGRREHRVYWYDDAWEHWNRRKHPDGGAPALERVGKKGG